LDKEQFEQLLGRLDAISRILVLALPEVSQTRLIQVLSESGMAPKDIASVIGTTNNTVSVALDRLKKAAKKDKKKK